MLSPLNPMGVGGGSPMLRPMNMGNVQRQPTGMYPQQQHGMMQGGQYPQSGLSTQAPQQVRTAVQQPQGVQNQMPSQIPSQMQSAMVPHDQQVQMLQAALQEMQRKRDVEEQVREREMERDKERERREKAKKEREKKTKKVALHHSPPPTKTRFFTLELNFWVLCALIIIVVLLILACTTQSKVSGLKGSVDYLGQRVQRLETVLVRQHNQLRAVVSR